MDNSPSFSRGYRQGYIFYQDVDAPEIPMDISAGSEEEFDYILGYRAGQDDKWELIDSQSFPSSLDFQYCASSKGQVHQDCPEEW